MMRNRSLFTRRLAALPLFAGLALAGCATTPAPFGGEPSLTVTQASALPPPSRSDTLPAGREYYISPLDKLELGVFGIEGLEKREVQVDSSGTVTFPIAGVLNVGGKTLGEVREELRQRLIRGFVRDPQVTVNLVEAVDRLVTIEGEVERPGSYPVLGKMSLLRAVAQAGSPTEFARLKEVVIFREVEGRRYAALYDLESVRRGIYADPEVYPNDVIVVDEARSRRLFKDLIALVPLVTTPLVLLLQ